MAKKTKEPDYKKVAEALLSNWWYNGFVPVLGGPLIVFCKYCEKGDMHSKDNIEHKDDCVVVAAKKILAIDT